MQDKAYGNKSNVYKNISIMKEILKEINRLNHITSDDWRERYISSETRDSLEESGEKLHRKNGKERLTAKDVGTKK